MCHAIRLLFLLALSACSTLVAADAATEREKKRLAFTQFADGVTTACAAYFAEKSALPPSLAVLKSWESTRKTKTLDWRTLASLDLQPATEDRIIILGTLPRSRERLGLLLPRAPKTDTEGNICMRWEFTEKPDALVETPEMKAKRIETARIEAETKRENLRIARENEDIAGLLEGGQDWKETFAMAEERLTRATDNSDKRLLDQFLSLVREIGHAECVTLAEPESVAGQPSGFPGVFSNVFWDAADGLGYFEIYGSAYILRDRTLFRLDMRPAIARHVARGNLEKMKEVLTRDPAALNWTDQNRTTLMHLAASSGDENVIAYLIDAGCPVDEVNRANSRPLHWVTTGPAAVRLAKAGANLQANGKESPPLREAILRDRIDVAEALIAAGCPVDSHDQYGDAAIHQACRASKDVRALECLLSHGANPNLPDNEGRTPALYAVTSGASLDVVATLARAGARFDIRYTDDIEIFIAKDQKTEPITKQFGDRVKVSDVLTGLGLPPQITIRVSGANLLHVAAICGRADLIGILLKNGLGADVPDENGVTPRQYAEAYQRTDVLKLLPTCP